MLKSTLPQLSIPKPCSQRWEQMSVNETGRFCDSCNKSVIDFTHYNDEALADFFKKSKGNVCGKFRDDQLEKPLEIRKCAIGDLPSSILVTLNASTNSFVNQLSGKVGGVVYRRPTLLHRLKWFVFRVKRQHYGNG